MVSCARSGESAVRRVRVRMIFFMRIGFRVVGLKILSMG
jgi:hypothetical protein